MSYDPSKTSYNLNPSKYGHAGNPPDRRWSGLENLQLDKVLNNRKKNIDKGEDPYKYTWNWIATELNNELLEATKGNSSLYNGYFKLPFKPEEVEWHCFLEKGTYAQLLGAQIRGTRLAVDGEGKPVSSWWPPLEKEAFQEAILEAWEVAKMVFSKEEVEDVEGASKIIATEKFMRICKNLMVLKAADKCLSWERKYSWEALVEKFESWKEVYWKVGDVGVERLGDRIFVPAKSDWREGLETRSSGAN